VKDLRSYLNEHCPHVHIENCKPVITAYNEWKRRTMYKYCQVCYKVFTLAEEREVIGNASPMDFLITCKEHREHRHKVQVDLVRRDLGIEVDELNLFNI
jgi:hypothetical protein